MSYILCCLNTPRPTFAQNISARERNMMMQHTGYWTKILHEGRAELFGSVGDPSGVRGTVILNVDDLDAAKQLTADDPVIWSRIVFIYVAGRRAL